MQASRTLAQLAASAACLFFLAGFQHLHQHNAALLSVSQPFAMSQQLQTTSFGANRLAGFQTTFKPYNSGSTSTSTNSVSADSIGYTSQPATYSSYPGAQRLEGYQAPGHANKQTTAHRQQKLKSIDAGTFSVPAGKQVEQVHVYIKSPAKKQQPQAVKFSQDSINLFENLAAQASNGLPTSNFQLPQAGYIPSRVQEADNTLESGLAKKLGAVQYEQDRFHFAPEMGPDFQG
mmetsp:Transcript_12896/g.30707  ORF Transcript_12896/g.30707 Transcript_12896/m.30707 type:complete len:233 (-) Transcript_12896:231-929(-)